MGNEQPQRKAEQALGTLGGLSNNSPIDEFTLKLLEREFSELIKTSNYKNDFFVLAEIYYHQKKYDKFNSFLDQYGNTIDLIGLKTLGNLMRSIDTVEHMKIMKAWFSSKYNPEKKSFSTNIYGDSGKDEKILIGQQKFKPVRKFTLQMIIENMETSRLKAGPFDIVLNTEELLQDIRLNSLSNIVIEYYLDKVLIGSNTEDENNYIKFHFNSDDFHQIIESLQIKDVGDRDYNKYLEVANYI
jgi:hypothetical protein